MKTFVLTAALLCVSATALADKIAVVGGKVFTEDCAVETSQSPTA